MLENEQSQPVQEFRIAIQGTLPPDVTDRIHQALHRALLQELANLDLDVGQAVRFIQFDDGHGGGGTQGASTVVAER